MDNVLDSNYILMMGASGLGKTTLAKHIVSYWKNRGYEIRYFDHNDQTALSSGYAGSVVGSRG